MAFVIDNTKPVYGAWRFGYDSGQATLKLFDAPVPFDYVTLTSLGLTATAVNPAVAAAIYQLNLNGKVRKSINTVVTEIGNWISNPADVGLVEARMTQISGAALTGDLLASWLNLGALRGWGLSQAIVGSSSALGKVELRKVGTTDILASCNVTIAVTQT